MQKSISAPLDGIRTEPAAIRQVGELDLAVIQRLYQGSRPEKDELHERRFSRGEINSHC
jgi:hypothetical protein